MPQNTFQFSDVDSALSIDDSGNPELQTDFDCINQSIQTILSTLPGERVNLPTFGSTVPLYVFESINAIRTKMLQKDIQTALQTWENRASINSVVVQPDYNNNSYTISVYYTFTGATAPAAFNATLQVQ